MAAELDVVTTRQALGNWGRLLLFDTRTDVGARIVLSDRLDALGVLPAHLGDAAGGAPRRRLGGRAPGRRAG